MNTGIPIAELVDKIFDLEIGQEDLLSPARNLRMIEAGGRPVVDIEGRAFVEPTPWAHEQIATHLQIPRSYYRRCLQDDVSLLNDNVNHWLSRDKSTRLLRLHNTTLRAFLSDRYKRIDHGSVLREGLEALKATDQEVKVLSSQVTESKMYIKALFPGISGEVKQGDSISPGVVISNSEIGAGSFQVTGFFYRDYCENGCVYGMEDFAISRRHLGGKLTAANLRDVYQDDTRQAENALIAKQSRDIIVAASSPEQFDRMLSTCRVAAESEPVENAEKGVEVLAKTVSLTDEERARALVNLIEDKDYSKWGLANAVTKIANTTENYERATELETIGSKVLTMQLSEFNKIRLAA